MMWRLFQSVERAPCMLFQLELNCSGCASEFMLACRVMWHERFKEKKNLRQSEQFKKLWLAGKKQPSKKPTSCLDM